MSEIRGPSDREILLHKVLDDMVEIAIGEHEGIRVEDDPILAERQRIVDEKLETLSESEQEILEAARDQALAQWEDEQERRAAARELALDNADVQKEDFDAGIHSILDAAWDDAAKGAAHDLRRARPGDHFPAYAKGGGARPVDRSKKPFEHSRVATILPSESTKGFSDYEVRYLNNFAMTVAEIRLPHIHPKLDAAKIEEQLGKMPPRQRRYVEREVREMLRKEQ